MTFEKGMVVLSLKGHDKGSYCVVAGVREDGRVLVIDGRGRGLEKPKAKNPKHLAPQPDSMNLEGIHGNRALRKALSRYSTPKA